MDLKELLSTTPEDLAKLQHKELKKIVLNKLKEISKLIENEKYDKIEEYTVFSPAGDGMGTDSYHINFGYAESMKEDIIDVIDRLKELKDMIKE